MTPFWSAPLNPAAEAASRKRTPPAPRPWSDAGACGPPGQAPLVGEDTGAYRKSAEGTAAGKRSVALPVAWAAWAT